MTPHISAKNSEIAKKVLMPGDPLRAKWIAENYLQNYKLVSETRNMLVYTGTYKDVSITVMGSGMGIPSIGLYSEELYKFYDVEVIYRVGSAGSYVSELNPGDVIVANSAFSTSTFAKQIGAARFNKLLTPHPKSFSNILKTAFDLQIPIKAVKVASNDAFYVKYPWKVAYKKSGNSQAVEMESFGLFAVANKYNKKAACLLTISDSFVTEESMSSQARQTSFDKMIKIALEAIIKE